MYYVRLTLKQFTIIHNRRTKFTTQQHNNNKIKDVQKETDSSVVYLRRMF